MFFNSKLNFSKLIVFSLVVVLTAAIFIIDVPIANAGPKFYSFDGNGNLLQPKGYREWVFVGAPVTPNDMNNGKAAFPEFHAVYIDPVSYKKWKRDGSFPDGTILVKELISVGTKKAPSGNGYFMGDYIGLEATIKDTRRFKNEPGNWAYFSFTRKGQDPKMKTKAFATSKCNSCHQAFAKDDWVFTQYYPVLRAAKPGRK
jgi:Cytochrome P460